MQVIGSIPIAGSRSFDVSSFLVDLGTENQAGAPASRLARDRYRGSTKPSGKDADLRPSPLSCLLRHSRRPAEEEQHRSAVVCATPKAGRASRDPVSRPATYRGDSATGSGHLPQDRPGVPWVFSDLADHGLPTAMCCQGWSARRRPSSTRS